MYSGRDNGNGQGCDWEGIQLVTLNRLTFSYVWIFLFVWIGSPGNIVMACVIGIMNPATQVPALPAGLVINNNWVSQPCAGSSGDGKSAAESGFLTAAILGWLFVGLLLAAIVGVLVFRWLRAKRRQSEMAEVGLYNNM